MIVKYVEDEYFIIVKSCGITSDITCVLNAREEETFVSFDDGRIVYWTKYYGKDCTIFNELVPHNAKIIDLKMLDEDHFISVSEDGYIKIWNIGKKICVKIIYTFYKVDKIFLIKTEDIYFICRHQLAQKFFLKIYMIDKSYQKYGHKDYNDEFFTKDHGIKLNLDYDINVKNVSSIECYLSDTNKKDTYFFLLFEKCSEESKLYEMYLSYKKKFDLFDTNELHLLIKRLLIKYSGLKDYIFLNKYNQLYFIRE